MYLSNAEKEALLLTGWGDVPPHVVEQGLEQALVHGSYIPGEESLRLRLADALDLEERLAAQQAEETQEQEPSQDAEEATTEGQEVTEEPPADQYRSPMEIVTERPEEAVGLLPHLCSTCTKVFPECDAQDIVRNIDIDSWAEGDDADKVVACDGYELKPPLEIPDEEEAAPAAEAQQIEDCDFSSFTKTQLEAFAADMFGVDLDRRKSRDHMIARVQELLNNGNEEAV
jgi:hypothetical protein